MSIDKAFPLFENIKILIAGTQRYVVRNVNSAMILAYFQIGKMIVEDEQEGKQRAGYARETILRLSAALNGEFSKGYSVSNMEYMRSFYLNYQMRISQSPIGNLEQPFQLSWTHYIRLLKIKDADERNFYELEAMRKNWQQMH